MRYRTSTEELEKELLEREVDCDILRHRIRYRRAEDAVRATGLKEDHEDFHFEVEMEEERMWEEEIRPERERWEAQMEREMMMEELRKEGEARASRAMPSPSAPFDVAQGREGEGQG